MNVYLEAVSRHLVAQGLSVDLLTRRTDPEQPDSVRLPSGALLRYLTAGPSDAVPKAELAYFVDEFSHELADLESYDVVHFALLVVRGRRSRARQSQRCTSCAEPAHGGCHEECRAGPRRRR